MARSLHIEHFRSAVAAILATATLTACTTAQRGPAADSTVAPQLPAASFRSVGPGIFDLGQVRLDQHRRCLSFPAVVNFVDVPMEYLIVHANGKTHESVLVTETHPYHIHVAALLLGARGAEIGSWPESDSAPIPGDHLVVEISWRRWFRHHRIPAARTVLDRNAGREMATGPWIYNGSRIAEDAFTAERDGSIVSLITDPDALINNQLPGRNDDENWFANRRILPPMGSKVRVHLSLENASQPPGAPVLSTEPRSAGTPADLHSSGSSNSSGYVFPLGRNRSCTDPRRCMTARL
jgi:hypothetical protein